MLARQQILHQHFCRFSCLLWGASIGFGMPHMINVFFQLNLNSALLYGYSIFLMLILAWLFYRYVARLFFFNRVLYLQDDLSWHKRLKAALLFLVIGTLLIMSAPLTITMMKQSLLFTLGYLASFMLIAWVYGVQLLAINVEPRALSKSIAIGFNCISVQNFIAIVLAYVINGPGWHKFFLITTFQFVTFMIYPLIVGIFLLMLVHVIHDNQ